jgi:hypothetical protein
MDAFPSLDFDLYIGSTDPLVKLVTTIAWPASTSTSSSSTSSELSATLALQLLNDVVFDAEVDFIYGRDSDYTVYVIEEVYGIDVSSTAVVTIQGSDEW